MISHISRLLFPTIWILSGFWLATQSATASVLRGCNPPNSVERELYRRGIVLYASEPTTSAIKQPAADIIQGLLRKPGFDVTLFNQKTLTEALLQGNLRKLTATTAGENLFRKRTAQLIHLLGDEADAVTMKNFLKVSEERLVIAHPEGAVDEYFEGFFRAFEGNPGSLSNLDEPLHSIAGYSDGAKARLKFFLSDPDAGTLWKLDDYAPGDPESWKRYITRGVLAELDLYKRVHKSQGLSHAPTAPGYDFSNPTWVQVKTCKTPNSSQTIADMKTAIDDLIQAAGSSTDPLVLHILKKPGIDSDTLDDALDAYKQLDPDVRNRVEVIIEGYEIGPQ
jgi:hypothetical protein